MIGIGVGIDYALFIVTRYRAALAAGRTPHDATVEAIGTAGRAVLFAGGTVMISLLGMLLMGMAFFRGLAFGSSTAVLVAMLAAVTLLPALLGFVGRRIDRLSIHRRRRGRHRPRDHAGTAGAGWCSAAPWWPRWPAWPPSWHWPHRCWACGSPRPTPATTRPGPPPALAYDLPGRGLRARRQRPAASSWSSTPSDAAAGAGCRAVIDAVRGHARAWPSSARPNRRPVGHRRRRSPWCPPRRRRAGHRGPRAPPARRRAAPAGHRRPGRPRRRRHGVERRLRRPAGEPAARVHRRRAAVQLPAAAGRVPLGARAA